ncbi:hypothetical protein N8772_02035 [Rickettsiales bacterium]|nr:hypothetical protein [Rickettsiales bacterium]
MPIILPQTFSEIVPFLAACLVMQDAIGRPTSEAVGHSAIFVACLFSTSLSYVRRNNEQNNAGQNVRPPANRVANPRSIAVLRSALLM